MKNQEDFSLQKKIKTYQYKHKRNIRFDKDDKVTFIKMLQKAIMKLL